jgi:hypothetical protein
MVGVHCMRGSGARAIIRFLIFHFAVYVYYTRVQVVYTSPLTAAGDSNPTYNSLKGPCAIPGSFVEELDVRTEPWNGVSVRYTINAANLQTSNFLGVILSDLVFQNHIVTLPSSSVRTLHYLTRYGEREALLRELVNDSLLREPVNY